MMRPFPARRASRGLAAVAALLSATGALAQIDTKSKAPIDVTANEAEVIQSKCLAVWRGDAEAVQADSRLRADTITVYSSPKGVNADGQTSCGGAQRIVADGHVYYVTPQQNARGDHAVYTQADDQIVITGDVVVVQGDDVARGDKLTLKISSHEATMESDVTGAGKAGRVRGVFYPNRDGAASQSAKP